jgi:PhnB protein
MTKPEEAELTIHEVYPYLRVHDAAGAIDFYARAFGAKERFRLAEPSGRIGHAEIAVGPTTLMLSDEYPPGICGPRSIGGTTVAIHLHVSDVDRLFDQAVAAGATIVRPLENHFYGERSGTLRDPFGHEWLLGGAIEEVSTQEMQRRYTALFDENPQPTEPDAHASAVDSVQSL